jgi:hypothetical protein
MSNWLKDKKAIVIGERDGVLEAAGAEIVFSVTECFV